MNSTDEWIDRIAALARLRLLPGEREIIALELELMIAYMNRLNEFDSEHMEPMRHVLPIENVFRPDETAASMPRERLLDGAPRRDDAAFIVPKTVE